MGLDGVVDHFTLASDEAGWLRNKAGATRLGFSVQLKFLTWRGRFPKARHELPDDAVEHRAARYRPSAQPHPCRADEQAAPRPSTPEPHRRSITDKPYGGCCER
ncbi:hypothetical protein SLUN_00510 [Streptomyces lunaelactis]|uniref:DUF4158 domain-containing protein n=1 Tax=Streptomyces lunaelactis TaxID=1535768 RepID=A0A2R4SVS0_9ACTN|nr:hypothetical protein SLUN_00510 [Streptomyces lunaelactis]